MVQEQFEEVSSKSDEKLKPVAFWQLYKNPILLRYARSRLRWSSIAAALIVTLVISAFTFAISVNAAARIPSEEGVNSIVTQYRVAFLPLFVIQIVIMMFIGTGSVASGITQEYDDGMVDYQRLSPMSPLSKIVGYLFGLSIREWFLFGLTAIFTGFIVIRGEIPLEVVWKVYSVFFLSIILYHLMALVVVHSMKRKRMAGKVIQLLVVVLYFIFPLLSQFGLVFFEYLTVRPILKENFLEYLPEKVGMRRLLDLDGSSSSVPFFEHTFNAWSFSILLMSSLTISFLFMLARKWKDVTSHLMSKPFALVFFGFFMFFLIGNTLPIAKEGNMSISRSFMQMSIKTIEDNRDIHTEGSDKWNIENEKLKKQINKISNVNPSIDAALAQAVFGLVCVIFACLVVYIVTPQKEKYLLGLRRSKNLKKKGIPIHWDESLGLLTTCIVVLMMTAPLYIFSSTLYKAPTMPDSIRQVLPFIPVVCAYAALVVMVFYLVYEAWENKGLFLLILFVWILPIMVATVLGVRLGNWFGTDWSSLVWVSSVSPIAAYEFGMNAKSSLPFREAFYFSFILQASIGVFAILDLIAKKLEAKKALSENLSN